MLRQSFSFFTPAQAAPPDAIPAEVPVELPVELPPDLPGAGELPGGAGAEVWLAWGSVPLAAVLLGVMAWAGVFSSPKLRRGPRRNVGLHWWDALVGLWLWLCGMFIAGGVFGVLATLEGADPRKAQLDATRPSLVLLMQVATFGPPVLWLVWRVSRATAGYRRVGLLPRRPVRDAAWALAALPVGLLLVMATQNVAFQIASGLGHPPPQVQHDFLHAYTELRDGQRWGAMALLAFSTVVVAPLLEEVFNRGLLQTALLSGLGPGRRWLIVVAVSLFFSLLHVGSVPLAALPALFVLGVLFGWLYERTGSLWPGILVHAGFNALNVAYVLAAME